MGRALSRLEESLAQQVYYFSLPKPEREYRFAAEHVGRGPGVISRLRQAGLRDWRIDFAWPDKKLAVEVEGGGWTGGRHTRGKGFEQDMQKYHHVMRLGWTLYRCDGRLIKSGDAVLLIKQLLEQGVRVAEGRG